MAFFICTEDLSAQQPSLSLNEIMASNSRTLADEDGDFEDWIELYNYGDVPVNLDGFGLSDNEERPFRWVFPDVTIQPGEFLLVWASNKDRRDTESELHTNFAIASAGEEILLTHPDGTQIDMLPPTEIPTDISLGRQPDGTGEWYYFDEPTPGGPNTSENISGVLEPVQFSEPAGFYQTSFELEITHPQDGVTIYYTTDGSAPTVNSAVYEGPISIYDRSSEPNIISLIPTTNPEFRTFTTPVELIPKANVIRVKARKTGYLSSETNSTYFVYPEAEDKHTLPVISIITDKENLFDDEIGIYVPGNTMVEGENFSGNYHQRGNDWEREASFELFDEAGVQKVSQNVGIRIHGGVTRGYKQKSLRIYARNLYGNNTIDYQLFPGQEYVSYRRILLRNSGNDNGRTMLRDMVAQSLVSHLDFDTQAARPSVVYINGEYWGIHNIRERYDRHYLERVYGVDPDNIDLLTNSWAVKEGGNQQYRSVVRFIDEKDLSLDDNMLEVESMIDMNNFLDYYAAQIYFVNRDWPHNNIDFWRLRVPYDENAPAGKDGLWRWMMFDVDYAFRLFGIWGESFDMLGHLTSRLGVNNREWPNMMIRNFLQNENFRNRFINRIADHLNSTFRSDRVIEHIGHYRQWIEPEIPLYSKRWQTPSGINEWHSNLTPLYEFAENRPDYLFKNVLDHFNLSSTIELTVYTETESSSYVQVNSLHVTPSTEGVPENPYPWTGTYFDGVPVTFTAQPSPGYVFSHWSGSLDSIDPSITIVPDGDLRITAHFVEDTGVPLKLVPFSFTNENTMYEESFAHYHGSEDTLPDHMFVSWDDEGLANPFTGIGNVHSANPETEYGNFTAYTADEQEFSFGIRERAPGDLRDARLFFAFTNNTDEPISKFRISYDVEAWFIGDRRNRIRLKYDDVVLSDERSTFETDLLSTENPSELTTPNTVVNGSLDENRVRVSGFVDITQIDNGTGESFSPLNPGETAYFRWQFSNAAGDEGSLRSGLAVNNISIQIEDAFADNQVDYSKGWNLTGLPVDADPIHYQSVFYNASHTPYLFITEFEESENLIPGVGYWVHLRNDETVYYTGDELPGLELELNEGWNLISGLGSFLPEAAVLDEEGIINAPWYGFNGAYHVTTEIEPGRGYWVRASDPGTVTLEQNASNMMADQQAEQPRQQFDPEEKFYSLHFVADNDTLQTLYFGGELPSDIPVTHFVFPPVPPSGAFDVRFAELDSRLIEDFSPLIDFQAGDYEIEIHLQVTELSPVERWELVQSDGDGRTIDRQTLRNGEAVALHAADIKLIELTPLDGYNGEDPDLPSQFALKQNFPNPFNSNTIIPFLLPKQSQVEINIYNVMGQRIIQVVNQVIQAGNHRVVFDASALPSGVYIYEIQAGSFRDMRKLTVIK